MRARLLDLADWLLRGAGAVVIFAVLTMATELVP
jgi:hypothetical protein